MINTPKIKKGTLESMLRGFRTKALLPVDASATAVLSSYSHGEGLLNNNTITRVWMRPV